MLADLLLLSGLVALVAAGFVFSLVVGLLALAVVLVVLGLALSDGEGGPWRDRS